MNLLAKIHPEGIKNSRVTQSVKATHAILRSTVVIKKQTMQNWLPGTCSKFKSNWQLQWRQKH